jgi:3-phosphoshikimate 1-carboxyvinyltransferase
LILASLATGRCAVTHLAPGADVRSTAACLRSLGAQIEMDSSGAVVIGCGLRGLKAPEGPLDCGNSGTTIRLLSGVIAGSGVGGVLDGDESLRRRPMKRVLDPLRAMGARGQGFRRGGSDEIAPLQFEAGGTLAGKRHELAIASAQVKSSLLLAGLWANGRTSVREPHRSRDHSERMLRAFGAPVQILEDGTVSVEGPSPALKAPAFLHIPGDASSAAFLVAAALMVPGGQVEIGGVNANPTRIGFINVLQRMGAAIELTPEPDRVGEPVAAIRVRGGSPLLSTDLVPAEIPSLIDELPILSVLATQAQGLTTIRGAAELRFKESDRIAQMARGLTAMGAEVQELDDGLTIRGPSKLRGTRIDAASDHRIAMSFAVAGLIAEGETLIHGAEWADISFPGFFQLLSQLSGGAVSVSGEERRPGERAK